MVRATIIIAAAALLACASTASAVTPHFDWDSCGTRYDRLKTSSLTFDVTPGLEAGATGHIHTEGTTDLHVPLEAGAWEIRVYEIGEAHPVYNTFGDLLDALHFTDPKNTTYEMDVSYTLPAAKHEGNFTVSLMATDQSHGLYNCIELRYMYGHMEEAAPVVVEEEVQEEAPAGGPTFWSCGAASDKLQNVKIEIDPPTPVKGQPVSIGASGIVSEAVTGGTVHYTAALDGIQLISSTKDLCSLLAKTPHPCPVSKGPLSIAINETIPSWAPSGNYSAKATGKDSNGNELTCLQGWFVL